MTGIERRLRVLEKKLGINKEPVTIVVRRVISNNPRVFRGGVEPSCKKGDEIYEHTVIIDPGEVKR